MILLLLNAFDLEEGSLTADNLNEMKDYLMATYPQEYAQLAPQIKNCSLEAELDTVSCRFVLSPVLPLSPGAPCEPRSCLTKAWGSFPHLRMQQGLTRVISTQRPCSWHKTVKTSPAFAVQSHTSGVLCHDTESLSDILHPLSS